MARQPTTHSSSGVCTCECALHGGPRADLEAGRAPRDDRKRTSFAPPPWAYYSFNKYCKELSTQTHLDTDIYNEKISNSSGYTQLARSSGADSSKEAQKISKKTTSRHSRAFIKSPCALVFGFIFLVCWTYVFLRLVNGETSNYKAHCEARGGHAEVSYLTLLRWTDYKATCYNAAGLDGRAEVSYATPFLWLGY